MAAAVLPLQSPESALELGKRLVSLLEDLERDAAGGQLAETTREHVADVVEALRRRLAVKASRDPRSLFDLDERLIDLMDQTEEVASEGNEIPEELAQEINDYFEAFRTKVDKIAGYWRWQESIAEICGKESERLDARKKAADGRLSRLKNMLLAFMMARGLKKLEGDKAAIGMQPNSAASLVVDDPLQVGERFFENSIRFTKTELQDVAHHLADGDLRRRLDAALKGEGWKINGSAVRSAIMNNLAVSGARLAKGNHVRLR